MFGYEVFGLEVFGYYPSLEGEGSGGTTQDVVLATIMSDKQTIIQAFISSADTIMTVSF